MSLGDQLDLSVTALIAVVVTTAIMYLALVVLLRLWGSRLLVSPASHTMATVVVLGAIVGRASLGLESDLEAGLFALGTVLILMRLVGRALERGARRPAEPLVVAGAVRRETQLRLHLTDSDTWSRLRSAGVGSLRGVALVLVEPNGELSVFRDGDRLDRVAVADVRDESSLPANLFGRGPVARRRPCTPTASAVLSRYIANGRRGNRLRCRGREHEMGRDWGRDFESLFQQHGRPHGGGRGPGGRGGEWTGQWGSWQWGPPNRRSGPPPWITGLFGLAQQERPRSPRVRRGDVRVAILAVLAHGPLNGYQVIQQISERTDGAWRPSPGSVYPTISQLEDEGLVEGDDERGRRTLSLSEAGRAYLVEHADEVEEVWAPFTREREERSERDELDDPDGVDFASLKPELGRVMNAVWQILTTGTDEQRRAAVGVLVTARRSLYQILADHPGDRPDDGHDDDDLGAGDGEREEEW